MPSSFGVDRATAQRKHDFQKQNKEGNNIRCSLLALMRVVRALATRIKSGDQAIHIPGTGPLGLDLVVERIVFFLT